MGLGLDPERQSKGVKPCMEEVRADLNKKHPLANSNFTLTGRADKVEPVLLYRITSKTIEKCARSGDPSGLDSNGLQRILCSRKFGTSISCERPGKETSNISLSVLLNHST